MGIPFAGDEAQLAKLSQKQLGLISRPQLLLARFSSSAIDRRLASGELVPVVSRVYRLRGAPESDLQRIRAACLRLGEGATASHRTAAWLWGLDGFVRPPSAHELTVSHGRTRSVPGFTVRQRRSPIDEGFVFKLGIPTTVLTRTLLDLAPLLSEADLEAALVSGGRGSPGFFRELEQFLCDLNPRGRAGINCLLRILANHKGRPPTGSVFETRLMRLMRIAGIPEPERQYAISFGSAHPFVVPDFAWPARKIALFADGESYHLYPVRARKDAWQRMKLAELGWRCVAVMPKLLDDPAWITAFARLFWTPLSASIPILE